MDGCNNSLWIFFCRHTQSLRFTQCYQCNACLLVGCIRRFRMPNLHLIWHWVKFFLFVECSGNGRNWPEAPPPIISKVSIGPLHRNFDFYRQKNGIASYFFRKTVVSCSRHFAKMILWYNIGFSSKRFDMWFSNNFLVYLRGVLWNNFGRKSFFVHEAIVSVFLISCSGQESAWKLWYPKELMKISGVREYGVRQKIRSTFQSFFFKKTRGGVASIRLCKFLGSTRDWYVLYCLWFLLLFVLYWEFGRLARLVKLPLLGER